MEQRPDSIPRGSSPLKTSSFNTSAVSFGILLAAGGVLFCIFSLLYTEKHPQYLILQLLTFIGIEICLLTALYRLTLHPLAKYPGPIWAAITDWYNIYYCLSGYRHILFYDLHQQYGPIVRYGPNRISINTSTALKDIYGVQANTQKSKVYSSYDHFFEVPSSVTTINKKAHAFKRRINVRALTVQHVKESEELIYKNFRKLCSYLVDENAKGKWSEGKDMAKMFSYMMSDIMGDVTFSRNWNVQDSEKNRYILDLLAIGACLINLAGHMPMLLTLKLHTIFFRKLMQGTYELKDLSKEQSDWRISQGDSLPHRDLFGALIDARDPETGQRLSNEDLVAEAGIYIVAGTDTTTTSLTSTLFYLLHYPYVLDRLQKDVRFMFADVEDIKIGTNLQSYRYLFACIDEAMRLSPGVGAVLPREVLSGGLMVDGTFFPEGVDVAVPCYSLHHHEDHYNDPFTYDPSRWLVEEGTPEDEVARAQSAFCPFGVGRTSCAGKNLAYQEMAVVISRMVWLFDMRLQPGSRLGEGYVGLGKGRERTNEFQTRDWFVATQDGPIVEFRYRG